MVLSAGTVVAGYRIIRAIGSGGMGAVYLAANPVLPRTDALKVLSEELSQDQSFRQRFIREADLAATLNHPNIVTVYSRGETAEGQLWIAMQYVAGTDAKTEVLAGRMTPARAGYVVGEIAKALDYAHRRKLVHRDVKPANFLLAPDDDDRVFLADFGIARALDDAIDLTATGTVVGSIAYGAPEMLAGLPVDGRVDIYSLGCSLYALLTGEAPFQKLGSAPAVIAAHLTRSPPRVTSAVPTLPRALDEVIATAMAKRPEQRYRSAGQFAAAVAAALQGRPVDGAAGPVRISPPPSQPQPPAPQPLAGQWPSESGPGPGPTDSGPSVPGPPGEQTAGGSRAGRSRWGWVAAAVVVAVAVAGLGYWGYGRRGQSAPPTPDSAVSVPSVITATIGVGKRPEAVAVDPATHTVYTANYGDATVSVIDAPGRRVTATVKVGNGPVSVVADPVTHSVYTVNNRDDTVSVIDATSHEVTATVKVGTNPWGMAIDPTAHTGYVANMWDYTVSVLDLATNTVTGTIKVGKNPYGVAVDTATRTVYTANSSDGTLSAIETGDRTVVTPIVVGNDPRGIAIDAVTHTAYVTNEAEGALSLVNLTTRRVTATVHVGSAPYGVAIDPPRRTVYTANHDQAVSVVDTATAAVRGVIRIGKDTFALAVDPDTHIVYTVNGDDTVSVIEPAD